MRKPRSDLDPRLGCLPALLLVVLAGGALFGVARAQAPGGLLDFLPDLAALFSSPFALALVVAAVTEFAKEHWVHAKGAVLNALALVIGALLGLAGHWGGHLEGSTLEGIAFGLISAFIASGLYDLVRNFLARLGVQLPSGPSASLGLLPEAAAAGALQAPAPNPDSLVTFLLALVRARFPDTVPAFVWTAFDALLTEFAGRTLTPGVQREIQHRFLDLLARAGAPGRDL